MSEQRPPLGDASLADRLDSWKAISAYLKRDVTTVQRWEKREGMPVHRHLHDRQGSVYAYRSEIDLWMRGRAPASTAEVADTQPSRPARRAVFPVAVIAVLLVVATVMWWPRPRPGRLELDLLDRAQFQMVTDFEGTEQAAAVSRDGRFVAFTSDRDGPMDVWVTQLGTGQFHNLTRGSVQQLVNPSVRTLGFSPDGAFVTFWARGVKGAASDEISVWAVPTLGGQPKPYLEGVAEFEWSPDGSRLIYHTPGPGDPTFVGDAGPRLQHQKIFAASTGLHAHFPTWSPDAALIYFVQGTVPDGMDVWRMKADGTGAERMTHHNTAVSHPVVLHDGILLYLATMADGSGPRLHAFNPDDRVTRLLGTGLDRYTSLAISADGRRLVATRANPKGTFWRVPIGDAPAHPAAMKLVALPTGRGFSPRLGPDALLYVAQKGDGDVIWKVVNGAASELWSSTAARILGGPELSADGQRVAFSVEQDGKTLLYVMNSDGTNARVVTESLHLRGAPAWSPDGQSLASGATVDGAPRLVRIKLDGSFVSVRNEFAVDPVWSPAGDFVVFSSADVGTQFPLRAVTVDGQPYRVPDQTLTRGARRLRFFQGRRVLLMMRGDLRHKDLWLVDLDTGKERQLTELPSDFNIRDFDVSPDGKEIVIERVQEHSDVVLIDLLRP